MEGKVETIFTTFSENVVIYSLIILDIRSHKRFLDLPATKLTQFRKVDVMYVLCAWKVYCERLPVRQTFLPIHP